MKRYCENVVRWVPNWKLSHWLFAFVQWWMRKSESRYYLERRYRKPRKGKKYDWCGNVDRKDARTFSVYIRIRKPEQRRMDKSRRDSERYWESHGRDLAKTALIHCLRNQLCPLCGKSRITNRAYCYNVDCVSAVHPQGERAVGVRFVKVAGPAEVN